MPRRHFTNPNLGTFTRPTVTDDGHYYGHVKTHLRCGALVERPRLGHLDTFMHGELPTDDGARVLVGNMALTSSGTGAFDNSSAVVADVTVGEDAHGLWFSGSLRDLDHERRRRLATCDVIADWRRVGSRLNRSVELVGLFANDAAMPVSVAASGALVASGLHGHARVLPGDVPYVGRALNHERPWSPHDRIDAATYGAAFDHLLARGADRTVLEALVSATEAAAAFAAGLASGAEYIEAEREPDGSMTSVTWIGCPLGPDPSRPGLIAAAAFVNDSTVSEPCPRCRYKHHRPTPRKQKS